MWRVDIRQPVTWDHHEAAGADAPGVKIVSFMQRADDLSHEQFARHWTEHHTPLALQHHVGLWNYTQNVVRRAYTPGGADDRRRRRAALPQPRRLRHEVLRLRRGPRP